MNYYQAAPGDFLEGLKDLPAHSEHQRALGKQADIRRAANSP